MDSFDFVNRSNAEYIERLYQQYLNDPQELDEHWRAFFAGFEAGIGRIPGTKAEPLSPVSSGELRAFAAQHLQIEISDLVHSYRELGHLIADLDPLGHNRTSHPLLDLSQFDLSSADLDREVGRDGFLAQTTGTLRDLIEKLRLTYTGNIGVEYMFISDKEQREWLQQRMEPMLNRPALTEAEQKSILYQIIAAQGFEEFLGLKFQTAKRFSLEGSEALIPMLNTIINDGAELGAEQVVVGMAHRGRLNVLAHVLNKPYELILSEFMGNSLTPSKEGDGDVKYHLGYSQDRVTSGGRKIHISLSFNPSHLELVNPVVEGMVRAKQYHLGDTERTRVVPLLIHGDAAFTGQGIVLETLALSEMPYWRTGGTIHVIINNQIGFTTMPKQGRFTPYPTDVAKTIQAPIFHVNGDNPQAVIHAAKLAIAFREKFHQDVMIDLFCYRRHGHNETDEPSFTQPLMYKQIAAHETLREIYSKRLLAENRLTAPELEQMKLEARQRLDGALNTARESQPKQIVTAFGGMWRGMSRAGADWSANTAISADLIKQIGDACAKLPPKFTLHPKLQRLVSQRRDMAYGKAPIDWGTGEMFALGSLVLEGTPVRFVGQDAQRGTFSHRHACLHDYNTGEKFYPLANLSDKQAPIIIVNTMLSELAVLGFEYGFSAADPRNLVIWEAQFGDFVNGAQAIIDQFIAAAESKWQKMCGLVLLLPHGYEGSGPEHSSAYIERFLALCAENNIQVCQPTTPAQYFHVLRRQMLRKFRKPLIVMMPKSLLRLEAASSKLEEFTQSTFQTVLDDPAAPPPQRVRRLLLCTGKVYYGLTGTRTKNPANDAHAIVRVEQLYPFPQKELQALLAKYRNATEVVWVQEEPRNRGAWMFMRDRLEPMLPETAVLSYVGRDEAASPATGSYAGHGREEKELFARALELPTDPTLAAPLSPAQAAVEKAAPVSD